MLPTPRDGNLSLRPRQSYKLKGINKKVLSAGDSPAFNISVDLAVPVFL
jgi:hypothetical protein